MVAVHVHGLSIRSAHGSRIYAYRKVATKLSTQRKLPVAPPFFVPYLSPEREETSYSEIAIENGYRVPKIGERVFSVTFEQGGLVWTATVGENLRAHEFRTRAGSHSPTELEDPALVLAIFPGSLYLIVTAGSSSMPSSFVGTFVVKALYVELFS